ncbi:MAG: metallophosphoesterase [Polyangiaceae bacterium]
MKTLTIAHVSDLHVSTYGDTFHDGLRLVRRGKSPLRWNPTEYEILWEEAGWQVLHRRGKRSPKVLLVDRDGFEHAVPSVRAIGPGEPWERAARKACRLEGRDYRTLARDQPTNGAIEHLLRTTPHNANLRLLSASRLLPRDIDAVFVTGDLTDNGVGYELVLAAFERFRAAGMLFAVPGNHDLYLFPLLGSTRPKQTPESKRASWNAFLEQISLPVSSTGMWHRFFPDSGVMLVGLDSCAKGQPRFYRHNGGVGAAQARDLEALAQTPEWRAARHRVVGLHHHVVPLPWGIGKRAPPEMGMRLDDASEVAKLFDRLGVTLVLHGHRHVSEQRQPAGSRFRILAAPSWTLGCRSGDAPSYWRVELGDQVRMDRVYLDAPAVPESLRPPPMMAGESELELESESSEVEIVDDPDAD